MSGFIKLGELEVIASIHSVDAVFSDPIIEERFVKLAANLKRIAPKANEFLYFSAIMMHSAESSAINSDGSSKLKKDGSPVEVGWEKKGGSWKWVSNDITIRPYKNSNGDIFPEEELLKAYKNWIGKPLCVDHKSSSVDAIRGIILDTYYDRKLKRVIALCALDKITYPDLANKVVLGYSTSVSMGTGVSEAICTDCGNVAKSEPEFCSHMRSKSCYGEINIGLQPIELSIVVNGADPQAKIRTIIAAANTINKHLSSFGEDELNRIEELENDLKLANEKLSELKSIIETEKEVPEQTSAPYGQSSGTHNSPSDETNSSLGLNFPQRYANNDVLLQEMKNIKFSLEQRLQKMEEKLTEGNMSNIKSEAYYQGGGGVNEPTPGQAKYPKDPLNEKLRLKEDKQMVGEPPFPDVGAVDGLHPSPSSVDEKDELERKKMLSRAEVDERAIRRALALKKAQENLMNKKSYWQGGGGVNEPEPKKVKYPIDQLEYTLREKEDKQMVGQKPFPDVGNVEGLHPSPESVDEKDELERKKTLHRASLKAKFVRVANSDGTENVGHGMWQIYSKDGTSEKLIFSASVDEISGGRSDALVDVIATKDFGSKMLEKIRAVGVNKAALVYKKGQATPDTAVAPLPDANPVPSAPVPMDNPPQMAATSDEGGKGDPKDVAMDLAEKGRDVSSDLLEAVRALTGEQAEMGDIQEGIEALPKAASSTLLPLHKMRKELNSALISGIKKSLAELKANAQELDLIVSVSDGEKVDDEYTSVINDAFDDAKKSIADAHSLVLSFAKYTRGTAGLMKKADEAKDEMKDDEECMEADDNNFHFEKSDEEDCMADDNNNHEGFEDEFDFGDFDDTTNDHEDRETAEHVHPENDMEMNELELPADDTSYDEMSADDVSDVNVEMDQDTLNQLKNQGKKVMVASFDLTTKEGRAAYRAKLAVDVTPTGKLDDGEAADESSLKGSEDLTHADNLANGKTQLDVQPSDELGYIENPVEQHKKVMDVAKAGPKVRKEAERLNQVIVEGKVKVDELDSLVSMGLDPEVVKYWKQFYGEGDKTSSEFGKLLTTETFKAKTAEEMNKYRVKLARAYELANEMVRCGLLNDDRDSISSQVDETMKWNDEGFNSHKRLVAQYALRNPIQKKASVPYVGLIGSGDPLTRNASEDDFQSELDKAFSGRRY